MLPYINCKVDLQTENERDRYIMVLAKVLLDPGCLSL